MNDQNEWLVELGGRRIEFRAADATELVGYVAGQPDSVANPGCPHMCIIHGLGDHSGRFGSWMKHWLETGWVVSAFDWRGHGQSSGSRGHLDSFDQLLRDLSTWLELAAAELNRTTGAPHHSPLVLYGQSLGGLVSLAYLLQISNDQETGAAGPGLKCRQPDAAIISSPALELARPAPGWKLAIARTLGKWIPNLSLPSGIRPAQLTSDKHAQQEFGRDALRHSRVTAPTFFGMLELQKSVAAQSNELSVPVLLMHGDADQITSAEATREFAQRTGSDLKIWRGLRHELHHEVEKLQVLEFAQNWLLLNLT